MRQTPEQHAFSDAIRWACNLSDTIERTRKRLAANIARNNRNPHNYWQRRIEEDKAELVKLRQELAEANAAVEAAREELPLTERAA